VIHSFGSVRIQKDRTAHLLFLEAGSVLVWSWFGHWSL